jgi:hypothetical protein
MGTVYGAGSLWQWRLRPDEPGHEDWCYAHSAGWREALDFAGANYVGVLSKIFDGLPFTDMEPNWDYTLGKRGLAIPDKLLIVYLPDGGDLTVTSAHVPAPYRVLDARSGDMLSAGELDRNRTDYRTATVDSSGPRIVVFCDEGQAQTVAEINR